MLRLQLKDGEDRGAWKWLNFNLEPWEGPESKYFGVGKIGRDQVHDYQRRKQMDVETVERWLGPWLDYDAEKPA